jgi:hypothetical protein
MIQAKFGLNWPSGFRGEDFLKSLQMDDKWWQQLTWPFGSGELKRGGYPLMSSCLLLFYFCTAG